MDAWRESILSAVISKLRQFKPNTISNIKQPWKLSERFTARAWCPLHDGRWAKLIVRVGEDGQVSYECGHGCSHDGVSQFLKGPTRARTASSADAIAPAPIVASAEAAGNIVYDARNRFRPFEPDAA